MGSGNRRRTLRATSWLGFALLLGGLARCRQVPLAPVPDSLAAEMCGPALTAAQFSQRFRANCHTGEFFDECAGRQARENTACFFTGDTAPLVQEEEGE